MSRVVIKFGGATLADGDRVKLAAQMVEDARYQEKVVVVSAPGRTTDQLLNLVSSFEESIEDRAYAEILSMGERTSAKVLTSALKAKGIQVVELDLHRVLLGRRGFAGAQKHARRERTRQTQRAHGALLGSMST